MHRPVLLTQCCGRARQGGDGHRNKSPRFSLRALTGTASCPIPQCGLFRAIVNEKPIAWPDEVLRMRPAYFRIFTIKSHRARILQIVVEAVLSQMVIENALPHFKLRDIRFKGNRASIRYRSFLDVLDSGPLKPIQHGCGFLTELHDPEFNGEAGVFLCTP